MTKKRIVRDTGHTKATRAVNQRIVKAAQMSREAENAKKKALIAKTDKQLEEDKKKLDSAITRTSLAEQVKMISNLVGEAPKPAPEQVKPMTKTLRTKDGAVKYDVFFEIPAEPAPNPEPAPPEPEALPPNTQGRSLWFLNGGLMQQHLAGVTNARHMPTHMSSWDGENRFNQLILRFSEDVVVTHDEQGNTYISVAGVGADWEDYKQIMRWLRDKHILDRDWVDRMIGQGHFTAPINDAPRQVLIDGKLPAMPDDVEAIEAANPVHDAQTVAAIKRAYEMKITALVNDRDKKERELRELRERVRFTDDLEASRRAALGWQ